MLRRTLFNKLRLRVLFWSRVLLLQEECRVNNLSYFLAIQQYANIDFLEFNSRFFWIFIILKFTYGIPNQTPGPDWCQSPRLMAVSSGCSRYTYICTLINPECRVYNLSIFRLKLKIGYGNLKGCQSQRVRSTVWSFT